MKNTLIALAASAVLGAAAQSTPPTKPLISSGPIVVTVQDFEAQMLRIPENLRRETRASLDRVATMTDALFVNRVLAEEARKSGLLDDPLYSRRGKQVLEAYEARVYLDNLEKAMQFPGLETRAREVYLADRVKYQIPETYEVEHILVGLWGRTREMALERLNEARAKIAKGTDFLVVAREYSTDPGLRQNEGKLGTLTATQLDTEIGAVLPQLKIGEVSQPILTKSGYHLVRVTARKASRQLAFDEVKEQLVEEERAKRVKRAMDEKVQAVRNAPGTAVDADALKALVTEISREEIEAAHRAAGAAKK